VRLLNLNVEAQCAPSRSAVLTGRHPLRSGTQTVPITGGPDGLTRWEVTIAQALSDAGYTTGMWSKWHLGSDPHNRVDRAGDGAAAAGRAATRRAAPPVRCGLGSMRDRGESFREIA